MDGRVACGLLLLAAGAAAQEPKPAFRIAGVVLNHKQQPVAGALVALWEGERRGPFLVKGTTDGQGRFDIAVDRETAEQREHPYGRVTVVVTGDGIQQNRAFTVRAGTRDLKIQTKPAQGYEGVVVDSRGNPVPAVVVQATSATLHETTTTDEQGRFVLGFGPHQLTVFGAGFEIRLHRRRIVMPDVRVVEGRLLDEGGKPIAGARIRREGRVAAVSNSDGRYRLPMAEGPGVTVHRYWLHAPGYEVVRIHPGVAEYRVASVEPLRGQVVDSEDRSVEGARVAVGRHLVAWTDRHGMFRFDSLPRAVVDIAATARGYLDARIRTEVGVAADRITLRLVRGGEVEGRVMHGGNPAMGARVVADSGQGAVAYSDDRGRFLLRGVPLGATHLSASAGERLSHRMPIRSGITLDLEESMRLFGVLVSDSGKALAGVKLKVGKREATTDENGRFDFGQMPVGCPSPSARIEGYTLPWMPRGLFYPGEERRLVALSRLGEIELKIRPVLLPGVRPTISIERREEPRIRRHNGPRWDFKGLLAGSYDITITAWGHVEYRREVKVEESMTLEPVLTRGGTLELAASPGAKVLVQTVSGKPAPVVVMELATGKKTVRGFGPGEYRFIARAKGELIVVRRVELGPNAPPQSLDLRGGKASELTLTVRDGAGDPVVGAKVTLASAGGFVSPTGWRTDEQGRAVLKRLFEGRVRVRVSKGELEASRLVDVQPGRSLTLAVQLG